MNQFNAVYGQLFCCDCPGALASHVKCDNKTGVVIAYPAIAQNNYTWLAGLICLLVLVVATVVAAVIYCKKTRSSRGADIISIIRFHDRMKMGDDAEQQSRCLVNSTYKNPGFSDTMDTDEMPVSGRLALATSASEESLDSPLLCGLDDSDQMDARTFPPAIFYDGQHG